ncbi:MAG: hypothetical protein WBB37_00935 [bacterium]
MYKFWFLVCLILLYGLGFGSQPDECLFKKQHLVISLDWRYELLKPTLVASNKYYFFNNGGIPNFTLNDTIQMQGLQTDASRVTSEKVMLESLGGLMGGAAGFGIACLLFGDIVFWGGMSMSVCTPLGIAGGTTIVGNLVMEPNGSFTKSLVGSTIGTGLGAGVLVGMAWALGGVEAGQDNSDADILTYCGIGLAATLSIAGSIIGYNHNISENSVVPMMNSPEENESLDSGSQRHSPSIKLQLITMRF